MVTLTSRAARLGLLVVPVTFLPFGCVRDAVAPPSDASLAHPATSREYAVGTAGAVDFVMRSGRILTTVPLPSPRPASMPSVGELRRTVGPALEGSLGEASARQEFVQHLRAVVAAAREGAGSAALNPILAQTQARVRARAEAVTAGGSTTTYSFDGREALRVRIASSTSTRSLGTGTAGQRSAYLSDDPVLVADPWECPGDCDTPGYDPTPIIAEVTYMQDQVNAMLLDAGLDAVVVTGPTIDASLVSLDGPCDGERIALLGAGLLFAYHGAKTIFMAAVLKSPLGAVRSLEETALAMGGVVLAYEAYKRCLANHS